MIEEEARHPVLAMVSVIFMASVKDMRWVFDSKRGREGEIH